MIQPEELERFGVVGREKIARLNDLPPETIELLARDKADSVRAALAGNPLAPAHVITQLSKDRIWDVRAAAVSNFLCPDSVFVTRSKDEVSRIRALIASNPKTPYGHYDQPRRR